MTFVNDSIFTFSYIVPKSSGLVFIALSGGMDSSGNEVYSHPTSGSSFRFSQLDCGDVDNNGKIQTYDAALALRYSVDYLKIDLPAGPESMQVSNYSIEGKLLISELLPSAAGSIGISTLKAGLYTIKITAAGSVDTLKFIKK